MLRKVIAASSSTSFSASRATSTSTTPFASFSSSAAAAAAAVRPTRALLMVQNQSVQSQWQSDTQTFAGRRSDYDFNKEEWARNMKFASFDCIMEPSIEAPKYTNYEGIKKNFRRYLNMKKLTERRPGYDEKYLKELYKYYKYLCNARNLSGDAAMSLLLRITTHTEASRLEKEVAKRVTEEFKSKSWGSFKMDMQKGTGKKAPMAGSKASSSSTKTSNSEGGSASAAAATSESSGGDSLLVATANNANDAVLLIKKPPNYDIHITDFALVSTYMAQMSAEDWLQMTFRCEYFERNSSSSSAADAAAASSAAPIDAEALAKLEKSAAEKLLLDSGYTKVLEYPCFELRMGDGVAGGVQYPFMVLGVMRRDGTRYGRDAQDASSLRKQFDKNRGWFS